MLSGPVISDESYCQGYQIYVREYSATGSLGTAVKSRDFRKSNRRGNLFTDCKSREKYAGKRIVVYLVAESSNSAVVYRQCCRSNQRDSGSGAYRVTEGNMECELDV